jgi:hypothetical protein
MQIAEPLGAGRGSVTDIYLPGWIARNLPVIHAPLVLVAAFLHGGNSRLTAVCAKRGPQQLMPQSDTPARSG